MKFSNNFFGVLMILSGFLFAATISVAAQNSKLAKQAKITSQKARQIARSREPNGKIESMELEKEHGKLIYSFDIRNQKGTITEVQVDAKTGKIVSVEEEDKKAEEKEKQEDARKKKTKH